MTRLNWSLVRGMFFTAIRSVLMHKLRSFLTILGLVFGVASVIVMLAVAEGASRSAQEQIALLGVNNVIVRSVKPAVDAPVDFRSFILDYGLKYDDLRRIRETLPSVVRVTPLREFVHEARYNDATLDARLVGADPSYFEVNKLQLARGRFLDSSDVKTRQNVCVIGETVAKEIYRGESALGKAIQVNSKHFFRVVGVLMYRTPSAGVGSSLSAQDLNRDIVIPLSTDQSRMGDVLSKRQQGSFSRQRLELSQITIEVADRYQVKATATALDGLLAKYHPNKDYAITVPLDLIEQAQATQRIFNFVLGATAAISLLVGGIGIMNIMLASVSERTREIGVRRALGARQRDIVTQFLVETAFLSLAGTVIGLGLGILAPPLVSYFSGMNTVVSTWSLFIAAAVSIVVGISSGIYPARRAAKLDPIEALRHS
jgi:putative ABC transport system permease protein